jgi:hypothetical protein
MRPALTVTLGATHYAFCPTYGALVAAEAELGSLFALVERASAGTMSLSDMIAFVWHCRVDTDVTRADFGALCVDAGLANITPLFRALVEQALGGQ